MALSNNWGAVVESLERLSVHQALRPTLLAMRKLVDMIKDDSAFADAHPTLSHASVLLSRGQSSRRVYVVWRDGEYRVGFVGPLMELSEGTTIGEDSVVRVVRDHLDMLETDSV